VSREAHRIADETVDDPSPPDADAAQWVSLARLSRQTVSPLARLEQALHPWTSYVIVPLFVVAIAGVSFARTELGTATSGRVVLAIVLARVIGKPLGILGAGWLAVRAGVSLPADLSGRYFLGAAVAAGVPFSVSLFVGELAFGPSALLDAVRVGVIGAAVLAGVIAFAVLRGAPAAQPTRG
jgi:Na+/H+ antiporter NhaA